MEIKVGCCGFPVSKSKYFESFKVVEIQKTFYRLIDEDILIKWRKEAPKDFEFSFKAFQGLTHTIKSPTWKNSGLSKEELKKIEKFVGNLNINSITCEYWNKMLEYAKILKSKIVTLQLPSSFSDSRKNIEKTLNFLENFETKKVIIALELRGWRNENKLKIFERFDNVIDITDINISEPVLIKDILYTRLHGKYEKNKPVYTYDYSKQELLNIKNKILEFSSIKEAYVLFNNSYMYKNALEFLSL